MRVELRCWMPGNQDALLGGRAEGIGLSFKAVFTTLKPTLSLPTSLLAGRLGWRAPLQHPLTVDRASGKSEFHRSRVRLPLRSGESSAQPVPPGNLNKGLMLREGVVLN